MPSVPPALEEAVKALVSLSRNDDDNDGFDEDASDLLLGDEGWGGNEERDDPECGENAEIEEDRVIRKMPVRSSSRRKHAPSRYGGFAEGLEEGVDEDILDAKDRDTQGQKIKAESDDDNASTTLPRPEKSKIESDAKRKRRAEWRRLRMVDPAYRKMINEFGKHRWQSKPHAAKSDTLKKMREYKAKKSAERKLNPDADAAYKEMTKKWNEKGKAARNADPIARALYKKKKREWNTKRKAALKANPGAMAADRKRKRAGAARYRAKKRKREDEVESATAENKLEQQEDKE